MDEKITILGAGAWGTALAILLHSTGRRITIWDYYPEVLDKMKNTRTHPHLPGVSIPDFIIQKDLGTSITDASYIFTVIPSQSYSLFWKNLGGLLKGGQLIVNCSKGIDSKSSMLISEMLKNSVPDFNMDDYLVLSGPSYASEVCRKIPTAVVIAGSSSQNSQRIQQLFEKTWVRAYTNPDVCGVEIAGALKNIIAIASGIASGIGLGVNTMAALITRGNAEIIRLGCAIGANIETFYGLAGIGDLMLTGLSAQSRNFTFGELIGKGLTVEAARKEIEMVIEGIDTVISAKELSKRHNVEMPIVNRVYDVIFNGMCPSDAVKDLMGRELKSE